MVDGAQRDGTIYKEDSSQSGSEFDLDIESQNEEEN